MKHLMFLFSVILLLNHSVYSQRSKNKQPVKSVYEIPFKLDRHLIIIEGTFGNDNTQKHDFIFDSGSSGVYLSEQLSKEHNFSEVGKVKAISPEGKDMGDRSVVQINGLNFQDLSISCEAGVVPSEEIFSSTAVAIIGLAAFEGYVVTIDYSSKKLIFRKGSLTKGKNILKLNSSSILEANILVNGKLIPAHFDCGAPFGISIPKAIAEKYNLTFMAEPKLIGKARTVGGEMDILSAQLNGDVRVGKIVSKKPEVELLTANFSAINIGHRFFINHKISIDFTNKLMEISTIKK